MVFRYELSVALIFCGIFILRWAIFLFFAGTNFANGKDWFFLLGINFCDFQEIAFQWKSTCSRNTGETICRCRQEFICTCKR